jgi:mannose-6-phosphate isomerase-like protein (cupin superfamily)
MVALTGKVWGSTSPLIVTPLFEAHRLSIRPGMRCSVHAHQRKWNAFVVLSGRLFIDVVKNDYPLTDTTELAQGDMTTVRPGEFHSFRTGDEACEAIEFYYPEALSEDIVRRDHGGSVGEPV